MQHVNRYDLSSTGEYRLDITKHKFVCDYRIVFVFEISRSFITPEKRSIYIRWLDGIRQAGDFSIIIVLSHAILKDKQVTVLEVKEKLC